MPAYNHNKSDRERVIANIEAVLRKVDPKANATEAEVDQALAYAQAQMRKYDIEMAEVVAAKGELPRLDDIEERVVREQTQQGKHELHILGAVCCITGTACYYKTVYKEHPKTGRTQKKKQMVIYGYKADVAIAHAMFAELITMVRAFARIKVPGKWTQKHYWYCNGFGSGLWCKARELKREQEKHDTAPDTTTSENTMALVVCKQQLVTEFASTLGLKTARRSRCSTDAILSDEYASGTVDGKAYTHRDKVGGDAAKAIC
jgi:hypothetical protein